MVTTFYPPFNFGGDGIYIQRLARALVKRGHHVEVIHDTDGYRSMSGKTPEIFDDDDGVIVHRMASAVPKLASLTVQQFGHPTFHRSRIQALLKDRFDIINFHNVSLIGGPGAWTLGNGVKLHTAHEHWMVCASHILWRDNKEICDERRCLRCVLRHKRPPQAWRSLDLVGRYAKHVDRFLMLSQSSADNHQRFGFKAPMTVFPSFLPESDATIPVESSSPEGHPYILFVGRLEVIKGLQDVIPAFDADLGAELWIAGEGEYGETLRGIAGNNPKVKFLGRRPMEELQGLYRNAVAVVTPSRCYEVFPLVVLEAFRESTPIIARRLGPYPEIIEQTGGGLLFDNDADLKIALKKMIDDPQLRDDAGRKGRAAFDTFWSEDVVISRYFEVAAEAAREKGLTEIAERASRFVVHP